MDGQRLLLASASPRRAELLRAAGIAFDVTPADVDEAVHHCEVAADYVVRVAIDKARLVSATNPDRLVLGADTTVVVDGAIVGKPSDEADAARMLRLLSGRGHLVLTAVALARRGAVLVREVESTRVEFASMSDDEIDWYVSTAEPMDKAGAYAIQGFASRFVTFIEGSYSNVVGLPVSAVYRMLQQVTRLG